MWESGAKGGDKGYPICLYSLRPFCFVVVGQLKAVGMRPYHQGSYLVGLTIEKTLAGQIWIDQDDIGFNGAIYRFSFKFKVSPLSTWFYHKLNSPPPIPQKPPSWGCTNLTLDISPHYLCLIRDRTALFALQGCKNALLFLRGWRLKKNAA